MFHPGRMNQIDSLLQRTNNQVTPKRSHSPRIIPQIEQGRQLKNNFFPSNKQNSQSNRNSVSPNKLKGNKKPMIIPGGYNNNGQMISPRGIQINSRNHLNSNQYYNNQGYNNQPFNGGYNQNYLQTKNTKGLNGRNSNNFYQNKNQIKFIMSTSESNSCTNHTDKLAQYKIVIDGQQMVYCQICASKLASQGFDVFKISNEWSKNSSKAVLKKPRALPNYPEYKQNKFYQQIMKLLKELVQVEANHYETINRFCSLEQHYNKQMCSTQNYYNQVIELLVTMKQDHLQDLKQEKQKYLQIADIQNDQLNQNVSQIQQIRNDIQTNIISIVTEVEQQSFQECVDSYKQKNMMLKHNLQQQQDIFQKVTNYDQVDFKQKVQHFMSCMRQLWEDQPAQIKSPKQKHDNHKYDIAKNQAGNVPVSIKNMHEMLPKQSIGQNHSQGAFRQIFADDGIEENLPIPSPQFKKI